MKYQLHNDVREISKVGKLPNLKMLTYCSNINSLEPNKIELIIAKSISDDALKNCHNLQSLITTNNVISDKLDDLFLYICKINNYTNIYPENIKLLKNYYQMNVIIPRRYDWHIINANLTGANVILY